MTIAADIGRATIAGIEARDASARLKVDAETDCGSTGCRSPISAAAPFRRAAASSPGARRRRAAYAVDLERRTDAVIAAAGAKFAPQAAQALRARDPIDGAGHETACALDVADGTATGGDVAKLAVDGRRRAMRLARTAQRPMSMPLRQPPATCDRRQARRPRGETLVGMLRLDRVLAGSRSGRVEAAGERAGRRRHADRRQLTAGGMLAQAYRARTDLPRPGRQAGIEPGGEQGRLRAVTRRPARRPARSAAGQLACPTLRSPARNLTLDDIDARSPRRRCAASLAVDTVIAAPDRKAKSKPISIDAAALIAAAIGMPAPAGTAGASLGLVERAVRRRRVRRLCRPGRAQGAARRPAAAADGARVPRQFALRQGRIRLRRHDRRCRRRTPGRAGVVPLRRGRLEGAAPRFHSPASTRPACCRPARGRRSPERSALSADVEGTGLSPVALIGSLQGSGKFALTDAQFAGLDPRAFDAVTRAVDQGLAIDAARISDVVSKALDSGQLAVKQAEGTIAVSAGQVRLEQRHRRKQGRRLVAGRQSRSHRRLDRRAAGALGIGRGRRRAARYLHGVEGAAGGAGAQHRRVGADRMAHVAGGRKSGEEIARDRAAARDRTAARDRAAASNANNAGQNARAACRAAIRL